MTTLLTKDDRELYVSSDGPVTSVTINRPKKKNAISHAMWREFPKIIADFESDSNSRVLILSGHGSDFSVGADISEFDDLRRDAHSAREYEQANSKAFSAFRHASKPTIAAIRGNCLGGGFGLAAACDLRLSTPDAAFSVPAARLGLAYPQDAMIDIVGSLGLQMAKYMTFSAARISAETAHGAGFLLEVIEGDRFDHHTAELAQSIARNAPLSIMASKAAIAATISRAPRDIDTAREMGSRTFESCDYDEGRKAFRERRKPVFSGT